jgi:hypothetical protein
MPPRRPALTRLTRETGLGAGVQLERSSLPSKPVDAANGSDNSDSPWGWVLNPVRSSSEIRKEHRLRACGISLHPSSGCSNTFSQEQEQDFICADRPRKKQKIEKDGDNMEADVIIVSSDDEPKPNRLTKVACSKKGCKTNLQCLNYLGQDLWEDESTFD